MIKHTTGPWTFTEHGGCFYVWSPATLMVADNYGISVARMRGTGRGASDDEQRANAQLIAAAPELLDACKRVDGIVKTLLDEAGGKKATDWGVVNDGLLCISKAIAKAEGQP